MTKRVKPPDNIGPKGRAFWHKTHKRLVLDEEHDLERLAQACTCLDTIKAAEEAVAAAGMFVKNRFDELREHPGVKVIRDNKIVFCRIIRELQLDTETPPDDARPPRLY